MKGHLLALTLLACAIILVSCASDERPLVAEPAQPTTTPIPLPVVLGLDIKRNELINEAVRLAAAEGCSGFSERLSGPPTRILVALTNLMIAGHLVDSEVENDFPILGPGGAGAPTVWVAAIEGVSVPIFGEDPWDGSYARAFIFVIDTRFPRLTGCVVRDAHVTMRHEESHYGIFEFEVLFDGL